MIDSGLPVFAIEDYAKVSELIKPQEQNEHKALHPDCVFVFAQTNTYFFAINVAKDAKGYYHFGYDLYEPESGGCCYPSSRWKDHKKSSTLKGCLINALKYIAPWKMTCYILVGFNSTIEQDLYRIQRCREFKVLPFVMPYRDYENQTQPSQYCKDLAAWVNKPQIFGRVPDFADFEPRKGFFCSSYLNT